MRHLSGQGISSMATTVSVDGQREGAFNPGEFDGRKKAPVPAMKMSVIGGEGPKVVHSSGRRPILAISLLIIVAAFTVRLQGIGRPFWLDEAWVANSVSTPSLLDSFYYDTWLQTTP